MKKNKIILMSAMMLMCSTPLAQAQWPVPPKDVRLECAPLPYIFDCSISRMPNPQFTSRCFYVADGQSSLMRSDHRMGFYNDIVKIQVNAGMRITATVTETNSGAQGNCVEEE